MLFKKFICDRNDIEKVDKNPFWLMEFKTTIYSWTVKCIGTQNNMSERKMVAAHKINLCAINCFYYYDLLKAWCPKLNTNLDLDS